MRRTDSTAHTIRFEIALYDFIHIKAAEEHRTFNGMVIHLLAEGIKSLYTPRLGKEEAKDGSNINPA